MVSYVLLAVVSQLYDSYTEGEYSNASALIALGLKVAATHFVQHAVVLKHSEVWAVELSH